MDYFQIHSDSVTTPDVTMNGPRRSKRRTSESLPIENGTPAKDKSSKKKNKKKEELMEISEVSSPKLQENSHKITDKSAEKSPKSKRKITENGITDESPKTPKNKRTLESEEASPVLERKRKASESSVGSNRKNSESFDAPERPKGTKRKNSESGKTEAMSVADRIKLLSHEQNQKSTPPRTDSVLQLLLQGLNNKDPRILESVLERADEELVKNTVKRLPLEAVVPLLEVLHHYIQVSFEFFNYLYFVSIWKKTFTLLSKEYHFKGIIYDFYNRRAVS